ncbi:SRR [Branchiostoma lanceolatum]|uniref:L-serine ammonia-lyase n=1 Tax=Branchiostoma lanceolatum TaxID=7740 RepID=A0A8J9VDK3_BRALA|nr:SRR [Branchiostoma lanceolatum]
MEANDVVTLKTVQKAADTLSGHVIMTPVQTDETLDQLSGRRLFLKCENFQKSGSFKFRGAYNAVSRLVSSNGSTAHRLELVAGSTGNFACGLAMAAQLHGVTAHMVMPDNSPECKKQMALSHGASLTLCEPAAQDIARTVNQVRDATGAVFISGAERPDVISGHGTMGLELLRQVPAMDAVVMPVGTGGMLTGVSVAIKSICPEIRVYGAEPEVSNCAAMSLKRGERYAFPRFPQSVADGLNGNIGKVPWTYIQRNVDDIFTVSEDEIKNAMRLMWERMQLVIEPSGAVGVAAVLSDSFKARAGGCKNVAVILSGRNVDIDKLSEIL